jgi:UDPglucose--hexose-1-phosphate uridylyltransferase
MHAYSKKELVYRTNLVLAQIGAASLEQGLVGNTDTSLSVLADKLIAIQDVSFDMGWQEAINRTQLLNIVTPTPDVLAAEFERLYAVDPEQAVKYYYFISESVENVKVKDIARNIAFTHNSKYGDI